MEVMTPTGISEGEAMVLARVSQINIKIAPAIAQSGRRKRWEEPLIIRMQ